MAVGLGLDLEQLLSRAQAANDRARREEAARTQRAQEAAQAAQGASGSGCQMGNGSGGEPQQQRAQVNPNDQRAARQVAAGNEASCRRCLESQGARQGERQPDQQADPNAVRRAEPRRGLSSEQDALRRGARGDEVKELQRSLNERGARLAEDGKFGPKTERALKDFQRDNGLEQDGVRGKKTTEALKAKPQRRVDSPNEPRGGQRPSGATRPEEPVARNGQPPNRTARIDRTTKAGQRDQMVSGQITVNGNTYNFNSGGYGRGSLPKGDYTISNLRNRDTRGMVKDGVGFSADMSDKYDARVGGTRSALRIHPDGGSAGTQGCVGIVGDAATLRRFREDLRQELQRNGGRFTLRVQ
ncbi:MAG: peptidoglycan-binding protein [Deltaproteobacteria bacterium]|nr:peptidoglycan-binding protein [Deltaproteobacteria bacterium]